MSAALVTLIESRAFGRSRLKTFDPRGTPAWVWSEHLSHARVRRPFGTRIRRWPRTYGPALLHEFSVLEVSRATNDSRFCHLCVGSKALTSKLQGFSLKQDFQSKRIRGFLPFPFLPPLFRCTSQVRCTIYAHRQEIGTANIRSPKGTVCSAS